MLVVSVVSAVLALSSIASPAGSADGPPEGTQARPTVLDVVKTAKLKLAELTLETDFSPAENPVMRIADPLRFASQGFPPLDFGGGVSSDTRQILALVLGLLVGFGIGHLVARDKDGFVLFLIVDLAIIVVGSAFGIWTRGIFWGIAGLALLISHIIQGLDAYASAGGGSLVQATREKSVLIADTGRDSALPTTRAFTFSF